MVNSFKEYAKTELMTMLSNSKPTEDFLTFDGFKNVIIGANESDVSEIFKLLSNDKVRKEFTQYCKMNNDKISQFLPEDLYHVVDGDYLPVKVTSVLSIILYKNIVKTFERESFYLLCHDKDNISKIQKTISKSFVY